MNSYVDVSICLQHHGHLQSWWKFPSPYWEDCHNYNISQRYASNGSISGAAISSENFNLPSASSQGKSTGGPWSLDEKQLQMNILELIAALLTIMTFTMIQKDGTSIYFQMDNMAALSHFLNMVGKGRTQLVTISREIWYYLLRCRITVTAEYIQMQWI